MEYARPSVDNLISILGARQHAGFDRGGHSAGLELQVESQLPPEEQILSDHRSAGTKQHSDKVANDSERHRGGPNHSAFLQRRCGSRSISNTLQQRPPTRASNFSGAQDVGNAAVACQLPRVPFVLMGA
jgi:activator of HSP90 ATPase